MNKEEKKRLKRLGAAEVERQSQELRELARQANPARPGSDDWAKAYSVGVLKERALNAAPPDRLSAEQVARDFVLQTVPLTSLGNYTGMQGWYWECSRCRDVLHSSPSGPTQCTCGHIRVLPNLPGAKSNRLVKLIGRG